MLTRDEILARLTGYDPLELPHSQARRSAVLVPLRKTDGACGLEVILTRRSDDLDHHAGQVAFPGGMIDGGDASPRAAALREAEEELGIPPERVEIVGRLDDMLTITNFHIVQVVGMVPTDLELVANPREVARVFTLPLSVMLERERWQEQVHHWQGNEVTSWHLPHDGEDIWGATATMLRGFAQLLWK